MIEEDIWRLCPPEMRAVLSQLLVCLTCFCCCSTLRVDMFLNLIQFANQRTAIARGLWMESVWAQDDAASVWPPWIGMYFEFSHMTLAFSQEIS